MRGSVEMPHVVLERTAHHVCQRLAATLRLTLGSQPEVVVDTDAASLGALARHDRIVKPGGMTPVERGRKTGMRRRIATATIALICLTTGCSGSEPNPTPAPWTPEWISPVGESVYVLEGLKVEVTKIGKVKSDHLGPWLEVSVEFTNESDQNHPFPGVSVECQDRGAGGYLGGSTIFLAHAIAPGTSEGGMLQLTAPRDSRGTGAKTPICRTPAYVQIAPPVINSVAAAPTDWVRIPDRLIKQLNAERLQ